MPTIERVIRILVIAFLEFVSFDRFYAQSQSCYDVDNKTICYFQPNVQSTYMTWEDAWKVCKNHNSTLPVIEIRQIEEKLISYVRSNTSIRYDIWLAGREIRTNVWQWLNGKSFGRHDILKPGKSPMYDTNVVIDRTLKYFASWARSPYYYICQCTDCILCQNTKAIRFGNGCIVVNNDEPLNLVEARNRCLDEGGDLATFEEDEGLDVLQQNRSLLFEFRSYWIGLRQNWWIWNETDSNKEIKYSNWLKYENVLNEECLSISPHNYKWSQRRCTDLKPFLCQTVNTSGTGEVDTTTIASIPNENDFLKNFSKELLIAAIIGAIVVIIITVVLVMILKKARNKKEGNAPSPDEKTRLSAGITTQPVESRHNDVNENSEVNEMSTYYAEIPRAVSQRNQDEHRGETQPSTVYATLEFDGKNIVYEEPVISKQRTLQTSASEEDDPSKGNTRGGSLGTPPTQIPEATIYANM